MSQPHPRAHGIVVLDKPAGISSAAALRPLKASCGRKTKVGHAGTLDPFATGVLIALVGDATRLSDLAMALPKEYVATVRFGATTDTLDGTGAFVGDAVDPGTHVPESLAETLAAQVGEVEQMPPAYSALKVDGRRAYELARGGETPALEPRTVTCYDAAVVSVAWPDAIVRLVTGRGYYVRSFARDWGQALGLPAYLTALRRTRIGPFHAEDGVAPDDATPEAAIAPRVLAQAAATEAVTLDEDRARQFVAGRVVRDEQPRRGVAAVYCRERLLGLARCRDLELRAQTVLSAARRELES